MAGAPRLTPASDSSIVLEVDGDLGPAATAQVHAWLWLVQREAPAWLVDLHPAYTSLLVEFDLAMVGHDEVARWLGERAARVDAAPAREARLVELPVRYGGEDGPDLPALAAHAGISEDEVVRLHSSAEYTVAFLGFLPGFPYLLGLPAALRMPRLASPRARVPAGSVAVADRQAGVYPADSPGGWRVIGRTERVLEQGFFEPGDRVRFVVDTQAGRGPA
ncbi:MAG: 5-oxoprolinase subunit PxpB [Deltaproteobacteria bacterium]|nr:5-oxoprolinase subunit PxpB [Deltaproteobacteria bacterium]